MGEETDNVVESTSKLQAKLKALTGVDILTDAGAYKDTYTILREIGEVWGDLDKMDQAAALELMAGKNRANTLAAILNNVEDLEGAYEDALKAEGSALKENEAYLESIQGRIDLFHNAVQTMWMNFIDSEVVKFIVDVGTGLIKLVDKVGVLKTALAGLFGGMFIKHQLKKNNIGILDAIFEVVPSKVKKGITSIFDTQMTDAAMKNVAKLANEGVNSYDKYAKAIQYVSSAKQAEILMNNGLSESEQIAILTKTLGSEAAAKQAIAEAQLAQTHTLVSASMVGELVNTGALTVEQAAAAISTLGLVSAEGASIPITKASALAKIEAAAASGALSDADAIAIITTLGLGAANTVTTGTFAALAASILATVKAILVFLATTPAGWAILAAAAITGAIVAYNKFGPTHKNLIEKLEEETEALQEVQTELQNVQSELETTRDRIDELNSKESLSFVEEEELNRLKEQTAELERQEAILQAQEKRAKQKQIETALEAIEKDPDQRDVVVSQNNIPAYAAEPGVYANRSYSPMISPYAAAHQNPKYSQDAESEVQNLGNAYDINLQSLYDATERLNAAKDALFEKPDDEGLQEAVRDAEAEVFSYNEKLDELDKKWQEKYGAVGFIENASTEQEKAWNEAFRQHQDYLDQQALINGIYGESKVLDRIFGATATDIAKEFKENFDEAINNGIDPVQAIETLLNSGDYDALLTELADKFGIARDEIVGYFTQVAEVVTEQIESINSASTYSTLAEEVEKYNEILAQTSEIVSDNTKVTEEYKQSLLDLGISETDLNKCFDENNKLIVKDAKALNDLVNSAKNETAQNIKLAKSQARLDYYELYKKMHKIVKETDNIDDKTRDYIDTIYDQMTAIEKVMGKYAILEAELLGVSNAYDKLADAQAADEAMDYGSRAEELVNVLGDAIVTKQLGTEAAKVAIEGLIPQSFIKDAETAEEKMAAIYKYFTSGKISQLFTLEFDDEGAITSVEMTEDNLKNFINSSDVFDGTWDNFTLDSAIQTMEDFMTATDMTREMAFAFFTELEKYDISWLNGNYNTIMDRLMSDNLEYGIYNLTQQMADLDYQLAHGKITADEYASSMADLDKQSGTLGDASVSNTLAWEENQKALDRYIGELTEQYTLLNSLTLGEDGRYRDANDSIVDPAQVYAEIEKIQGYVAILQGNLDELQEPTEIVMQFAVDKLQADMDDIEQRIGDIKQHVHYIFDSEKNEFVVSPTINTNDPNYQEIVNFVGLLNKQYTIETQMGGDAPTTADQLQTIADTLSNIVTMLMSTFGFEFDDNGAIKKIEEIGNNLSNIPTDVTTTYHVIYDNTPAAQPSVIPSHRAGAANVTGNAFADGSIGTNKTEMALMGELGPELVVRNGRWFTVGDNGAEFAQVKKGDIIFNHKQSEELLKHGRTASRGKLRGGDAFASGTAYAMIKDAYGFKGLKDEIRAVNLDETVKHLENTVNNAVVATESALQTINATVGIDSVQTGSSSHTWGGGNLSGDYTNQTEDASEPFEDVIDWIEVLMEEHEEVLSKLSAQLENAATWQEKNNKINEMIARNQKKLADSEAGAKYYEDYAAKYLSQIPAQYREMAQNGAIAIKDFVGDANEEVVEAIQKYRDYIQKAADLNQQAEEVLTEIRDLTIQKIDNIQSYGDAKTSIEDAQTEKLQNAVDLIEESGNIAAAAYYEAMMENSSKKIEYWKPLLESMQAELDKAVLDGTIVEGSVEWYKQLSKLYEIQAAIDGANIELEEFQNAINDIYWDNFDQLINRLGYLKDETQSLIDLMSHDDLVADPTKSKHEGGTVEYWTADDVNWTDEGLASLGLYAQQMEIAEYTAKQYAEAIKDLEADYAAGLYSESEYIEKLNELKEAQYDSIEAYYDAQDAIVELNKTRVDSIKKGIEKEVEAYEELINAKKKALDAEQD